MASTLTSSGNPVPAALVWVCVSSLIGCASNESLRRDDAGSPETPERCTGADRTPRTYYEDRDGDGFGVAGNDVVHGCFDQPPSGYAPNTKDCDDTDAARQLTRFRDRDGDGFGDLDAAQCVSASEQGYSDRADDCDDDSAARSPAASEIWLDGVDQDCDGSDDLRGCIAAPGKSRGDYAAARVIAFPDLAAVHVDRDEHCAGPDLYFVLLGACPVCGGGRSSLVVANRGTQPAGFRITSNAEQLEVQAPLSPQRLSDPLEVGLSSPESDIQIELLDHEVDCDPSDNVRLVEVGFTDCAQH